ncbi:MAG: 3-dehydroquinate synthase, partial [Bacillota bacterium]
IETAMGYGEWLHGEAVAAGMVLAARYSAREGKLARQSVERLEELLRSLGLPVAPPRIDPARWLEFIGRDKKNEAGRVTLILLDALGDARVVKDSAPAKLEAFLAA